MKENKVHTVKTIYYNYCKKKWANGKNNILIGKCVVKGWFQHIMIKLYLRDKDVPSGLCCTLTGQYRYM